MGIRKEYYCNFCHDVFNNINRPLKDLIGIHWTGAGGGDIMNIRSVEQTENHSELSK